MPAGVRRILVTGGFRPFSRVTRRAAQMIGATLAENGFGLVTGNATGVDDCAASAYLSAWASLNRSSLPPFEQLAFGCFARGSLGPLHSFHCPPELRTRIAGFGAWIERALQSDAAVMVGREKGARSIEREEDFVFWEVGTLLRLGKSIAPVLVDGATLPDESQLPETLRSLLAFQAPTPLSNTNWAVVVRQLLQQAERVLPSQTTQ